MHHIRLIGLVLFITTAFLAMAAAVTQTTHIRFKRPSRDANGNLIRELSRAGNQPQTEPQTILPPEAEPMASSPEFLAAEPSASKLQFIAVPVIYPLLVSGTTGLLMWFAPAPLARPRAKKRRRR